MTPEEYFEWEQTQEVRHEYYEGEVFAMSGATHHHALITANLIVALGTALRGSGCRVLSSDMRVQLAEGVRYTYPDLSVVCGEPAFADDRELTLLNPTLLVEVLSPSTAEYDRGDKFAAYRRLPSLREVVFVEQERRSIEVFRRGDEGRWTLYELEGGAVALASVGATLRAEEVYDGVDFAAEAGGPPGRTEAS
ncbi:MAG: Uma2 family endonuclease [Rhodothermales bacterium]|nr:Uma2 family endonuclease [Rhodothermales bacterium]